MPSTDQACVPVPVSMDRATRAGRHSRGIGRSAPPAQLPALQKYDSRTACLRRHGSAPTTSSPTENDRKWPRAHASRLTAGDGRWPPPQVEGTLTPKVAQNNSAIDGLGFHLVNFASAAVSREHLLIRPGVHLSTGRCVRMTDLMFNDDLFVDGLAPMPPVPQRNRTASQTTRTPQFNSPTSSRRALRGRKE